MLSKLFSNIKLGLSIWLVLFSIALWSTIYYLNCIDCFTNFIASNWIELAGTFTVLILSIFLSSSIFNNSFRITANNYYSPLFLAIFISWIATPLHFEHSLEVLLIALFYLNTYNILNGTDNNQVGFHLNAGLLSFVLTWLSPIGVGFLLVSFWQATIDSHSGWRKFILPFYSFAISFLILLGIVFLFDYQEEFLSKFRLWNIVSVDLIQIETNAIQITFVFIFFLLAQIEYFKALRKAPVLKRKILSILNIQFIVSLTLFILFGSKPEHLLATLFALSVLFANYLQYIKLFMLRELLIWISILVGVVSVSITLL